MIKAKTLEKLESSRATGQWSGVHENSSFGPCSSSLAFDTDLPVSSKMVKDADEAMSESSWTALAKRKEAGGALTWRGRTIDAVKNPLSTGRLRQWLVKKVGRPTQSTCVGSATTNS